MTDKEAYTLIKTLLAKEKVSEASIAKRIGMAQKNFNRKLNAGNLRFTEVMSALENLGYEIELKKKGEPFALKIE